MIRRLIMYTLLAIAIVPAVTIDGNDPTPCTICK